MELYQYFIVIVGGFLAGCINTLAGNGSAITLTILTEVIGLSGNVANGTNRIGIFFQSFTGSVAFYRNGKFDLKKNWHYIVIMMLGALFGVYVAIQVDNAQFKSVFKVLIVLMLIVTLVNPKRWLKETDQDFQLSLWIAAPVLFALGFYGGFIQMGMGVFMLAFMVLVAKYSIIESNVIKLIAVGLYTIIIIAVFQWKGLVDWHVGLTMAVGQSIGGWVTANKASRYPQANLWAYRLLIFVIFAAIIKMFFFPAN
ncbi:MAG: sulfite exporter TauE/SafE family protein [Saprospiraceae bacterium]